jgi:hypothetical protein
MHPITMFSYDKFVSLARRNNFSCRYPGTQRKTKVRKVLLFVYFFCLYRGGYRVCVTKVAVVRESHKLFLSLTGEFAWKVWAVHKWKWENFHSNFPVRLKKILWEARSTPTLVSFLVKKHVYTSGNILYSGIGCIYMYRGINCKCALGPRQCHGLDILINLQSTYTKG